MSGEREQNGLRRQSRHWARDALLVVIGLAIGLGGFAWFTRTGQPTASVAEIEMPADLAASEPVDGDGADNTREPATDIELSGEPDSPEQAVAQFLAAEASGKLEQSFALLSTATKDEVAATAEEWIAVHADLLPPVTDYEIDNVGTGATDTVDVNATVQFESSLTEVSGLVPAQGRVTMGAVEEGDSWRVDLASSSLEPIYPSDDTAAAAVSTWATARQKCESKQEWDSLPIGDLGPAAELCGTEGDVVIGQPLQLDELDAEPFRNLFGADVTTWARVVPVSDPVPMRAVVAPVGNQWLVMGVLAPEGS